MPVVVVTPLYIVWMLLAGRTLDRGVRRVTDVVETRSAHRGLQPQKRGNNEEHHRHPQASAVNVSSPYPHRNLTVPVRSGSGTLGGHLVGA